MRISMLSLLLLAVSTSCVSVMADQTLRTQTKSFPARGVSAARLETGAGLLEIIGVADLPEIEVRAEYRCNGAFSVDAQRILDNLRLVMELRGDTFFLKSEHLDSWNWGDRGWIDVYINLPDSIDLEVDDGSGTVSVVGMGRNVEIKDGSGEIELIDIGGNIRINDGSGEIRIRNAAGEVSIDDGSGSIIVNDVAGDLIIPHDGSGEIRVQNARRNVSIDDGSGSIDVRHVGGSVRIRDGSGSIDVNDVAGDLIIPRDGSGSIHYSRVMGKADVPED
jgi:DUF4097 and DUF4098 domain-containing protein YvlB